MESGKGNLRFLTDRIKAQALRIGFLAAGIAPASAFQARRQDLNQWIGAGFSGQLQYMESFFKRQEQLLADFPDLTPEDIRAAIAYASEMLAGEEIQYAQMAA